MNLVIQHAPRCVRQEQPLPRARDADVAEAAFFLHARLVVAASGRRKQVFLHADHEHIRKFKTLRAVQRHHRHRAAVVAHLIQIGHQRHVFQIIRQRRVVGFLFKFLDRADKFANVLHAGTVFVVVFLGILAFQPDRVDDILHQFGQLHRLLHHGQAHHQLAEFLHALARAGVQALRHIHARGQQRHFLLRGVARQFIHRRIADGALGHVDDAPHGNIVRRVDQHAQISQNILDLLAVIEFQAAVHPVADARLHERFFDDAGLRIGSIEHGKAAKLLTARFQFANLLANPGRLLALVACPIQPDQFAGSLLRPQRFILAVGVERDDLIRRVQNICRGAVILLQLDDLCIRKILLKIENVSDIRAAPAVDGLIVVADDAEVPALRCQQAHEHILRVVRILILIDMDIPNLALIGLQHRRMLRKKLKRFNDQIVEIQRVRAFQLFLIRLIDVVNELASIVSLALRKPVLRAEQLVFRIGNFALDLSGRQKLVVDVQLFQNFLQRAHLVVVVVDREGARVAQFFDVAAQNFRAAGVERRNPDVLRPRARQFFNALPHLLRRLVGEGDRHNRPRRHTVLQQVRHAIRQRAGLARSRARKHQKRPFKRFRREPLFSVQVV